MRRVVSAVVDVVPHRVVDVFNQLAVNGQSEQRGKKALGDAVGRINPLCVSPFGDDVTMTEDDAVCFSALFGDWPAQGAEGFPLGRKISRHFALLRLGVSDRLVEKGAIHPDIFSPLALPRFTALWEIAFLCGPT